MIMTKEHLFWKYSDTICAQLFAPAKLVSLATFCKMFHGERKHIKFPCFCMLSQCNICTSTNNTLANWQMSSSDRMQLKQHKLKHLQLDKAE